MEGSPSRSALSVTTTENAWGEGGREVGRGGGREGDSADRKHGRMDGNRSWEGREEGREGGREGGRGYLGRVKDIVTKSGGYFGELQLYGCESLLLRTLETDAAQAHVAG